MIMKAKASAERKAAKAEVDKTAANEAVLAALNLFKSNIPLSPSCIVFRTIW